MLRGRWGLVWVGSAVLMAQDADRAMISSRAAEIEAQRRQKAADLQPETLSKPERVLQVVQQKRVLERITAGVAGFRIHLGGLITGSGFALGPEYYRRLFSERLIVRSSARASFDKFYLLDAELRLPRLADDRAFVNLYTVYRNYPHIDYYGPGPDSAKTGRSVWAVENTLFEMRTGVQPFRHFSVGALGRYLLINVGPGRDDRFISADRIYSPAAAPGIQRQSDYLVGGGFAQYDYRDNPGGPRGGGYYSAQFSRYSDRELRLGSFYRLDLEAQQYIGFTNRRRVIALRGRTIFTDPRAGQFVPFYLQPTVGGSDGPARFPHLPFLRQQFR